MKLTTSRNKTCDVLFVDGPTRLGGTLMLRMADSRPILEVGAEFDGLEWLKRESDTQGNKKWTGYTELISIRRVTETDVLVELSKP